MSAFGTRHCTRRAEQGRDRTLPNRGRRTGVFGANARSGYALAHWRAKFHLAEACFRDHYGAIHTRNAVPPMSRLKKRIKNPTRWTMGLCFAASAKRKRAKR